MPELANPIFPALAQAMEARATEAGLATILCNTRAAAFREADYVHMLLDRRVDGMIFIACEMTHLGGEHEHYSPLAGPRARGSCFVNGALDGLDVACVSVDERHAGFLATRHLIALGHTRIGFVAGPADYLPTRLKAAGRVNGAGKGRPLAGWPRGARRVHAGGRPLPPHARCSGVQTDPRPSSARAT